ncbi:MAG: glycosyltransferase [Bdellovibrionales bacterium]|nr:glycosyltransferase [Bdellovibrionales bacterium]
MNGPSITIGIITKDRPEFLGAAIESALTQNIAADEILIVLDGPNAETEAILKPFEDKVRSFTIPPSGRPAARNKVVEEFRSDFLMWLDDDDVLDAHAISSMKTAALNDPSAEIIYSNLIVCNEQLEFVSEDRKRPLLPASILHNFFKTVPVANGGTMIHRRCFERVGAYDDFYQRGQDYDFFARAASAGVKFSHNNNYFYMYRSHGGSTAARENLEKFSHFRVAVMRSLLQRHNIDQIFSHLPWKSNSQFALLQAAQEAAVAFTRYRGYDEAAQILSQAGIPPFDKLVSFLVNLIRKLQTKELSALTELATDPLFYTEMAQQLLDAHLPNVVDPVKQDTWRADYLAQRFAISPIERVFASYDWDDKPEESFQLACTAAAGQFIRCGSLDAALEVIDQLASLDPKDLAPFLAECIEKFRSGGFTAVRAQNDFPAYYERLTQRLVADFGARELELNERAKEQRLLGLNISAATESDSVKRSASYMAELADRSKNDQIAQLGSIKRILEEAADTLIAAAKPKSGSIEIDRDQHIELPKTKAGSRAKVSVVIPTVNRPELLLEAVKSSAASHHLPLEVVIVNDGGPALSDDLRSAFVQLPLPVTIVRHNSNLGLAAARNTGIQCCGGEWIAFLDDDDIFVAGGLEILFKAALEGGAEIVAGDHIRQLVRGEIPYRGEYNNGSGTIEQALAIENSHLVSGSFIINKSLLLKIGGYRQDLIVQEDYNLNLRASFAGKLRYLSVPNFVYRVREDADRMNTSRRLAWFGTSALNHEIYRKQFGSSELTYQQQRSNQYEHIAKAVYEGLDEDIACQAISCWWNALAQRSLPQEIALDQAILNRRMPTLARRVLRFYSSESRSASAGS